MNRSKTSITSNCQTPFFTHAIPQPSSLLLEPDFREARVGGSRSSFLASLLGALFLPLAFAASAQAQVLYSNQFQTTALSGGTIITNPFPSDPYDSSTKCMRMATASTTVINVSGITASSGVDLELSLQVDTATAGPNFILRPAVFASNGAGGAQNGYGFDLCGVGSGSAYTVHIYKYNNMGLWVNPPTLLATGTIAASVTGEGGVTTSGWNALDFTWSKDGSLRLSLNGAVVLTAVDTQFTPGILATNGLGLWSWNNNANLAIDNLEVTALPVPNGAAALGYTKRVINERPVSFDLAPGRNGNYKWFRGIYYNSTQPPVTDFATVNGLLALSLHGGMVSTPLDFTTGALPLLSGAKGFYVEYQVALSDNNADHWPAVWIEPMEHNLQKSDHYAGDPAGYERWMELDVDEGGFGPGTCSTAISWTGIYPNYVKQQNGNNVSQTSLDRTQWHTYGASYDPITSKVAWWLDGVKIVTASSPDVPAIAAQQHFYLLINNQTQGAGIPYTMYVAAVKAYTLP